jgi:ferredoxin
MRIRVINELCQGHGMCFLACPELFELSDQDGHAILLQSEVNPELAEKADHAIKSCPEGAIQAVPPGES